MYIWKMSIFCPPSWIIVQLSMKVYIDHFAFSVSKILLHYHIYCCGWEACCHYDCLSFLRISFLSDLLLRFLSLHLIFCGFTIMCPCVNLIAFFQLKIQFAPSNWRCISLILENSQSLCTLGLGSATSGKTHTHKNKKQSLNQSGLYKMFISFSTTLGHPGGV